MPCGHPGLPLRATAWGRAGRDGRMAVLIEQQDGRCDRWFRRWTIGRLEVDIPRSRVTVIEVWASLLLGQQILQLAAVTGPDFLAQRIPIGSRKPATAPMRGHASAAAPSHEYNPRSSTSDHDRNPCHLDGRTGARRLGNPRRDFVPFAERTVGGDQRAFVLIATGDQLEQHVGVTVGIG